MTEAHTGPNEAPDRPQPQSDWLLEVLIQAVNASTSEVPITLNVGGQVVTGWLTSGRRFLEEVADQFGGGDQTSPLRITFRKAAATIYGEDKSDDSTINFIHLRDARFLGFGMGRNVLPTDTGVWWRGRVSEVDGFFLGKLRTPSEAASHGDEKDD